jgi:hypothetical protein
MHTAGWLSISVLCWCLVARQAQPIFFIAPDTPGPLSASEAEKVTAELDLLRTEAQNPRITAQEYGVITAPCVTCARS